MTKFNVNGSVNYYGREPFTLKIVKRKKKTFSRSPGGHDGRSFRRRGGGKKKTFLLTSNVQISFYLFACFCQ